MSMPSKPPLGADSSTSANAAADAKWQATLREEQSLHAAAIPPQDMPSCMSLFDTWASCFALGPQIKSVYRYGSPNNCKPKLEDFKYCLTMRGLSDEERRQKWIRRKAEITAAKRLQRSSEDIWQARSDMFESVAPAAVSTEGMAEGR